MKFIKENISWIAPTVAIVLVATGFLDRENGFSLFFSDKDQAEQTDLVAAEEQRRWDDLNATVQAAITVDPTQGASTVNGQEVVASLQSAQAAQEDQEVSRDTPVDLLQTSPMAQPLPAPLRPAKAFDSSNAATFFEKAQDKLAKDTSCGEDLRALAATARVYFPTGGLAAEDAGLIRARLIGQVALDCPGFSVQVEGHSDPSGDPVINQALSEKRAKAVISRLASSGIDTSSFIAVGFGDTRPSGTTGPKSSGYYDRRVEFSIVETTRSASTLATARPWQTAASDCVRELESKVDQTRLFYAPRAITVSLAEMESVYELAAAAAQCEGARLRLVGQHSDQPGVREDVNTGRMRALALMGSLVAAGFENERILIGAPSYSVSLADQPSLPNSRVDFQVITD